MNSSKVFKKPGSFIPEKIIASKKELSGWRSVTIPDERKDEASAAGSGHNHFQRRYPADKHEFARIDRHEYPESAHKTDFSSPEAPSTGEDGRGSSGPEDEPSGSPVEPPDLERLQEEAYNTGLRDGLKMADEDFGSSAKALFMACEQINTLRETVLNNSMGEMEDLVLAIAEKIIRHSVTEQDRTIVDTVEEAIRQAVKSDELIAIIKSKSKEFIDSLSGLENIVVQANPAIERGGCSIDSSTSMVDATIAGQLHIIEEKIKGKT